MADTYYSKYFGTGEELDEALLRATNAADYAAMASQSATAAASSAVIASNAAQGIGDNVRAAEEAKEGAKEAQRATESVAGSVGNVLAETERARDEAQAAASNAAAGVEQRLSGYVSEAENAKNAAEVAASNAASDVEHRLSGYVDDAETARVGAEAAQKAAEKARDEAQAIAGGDFVTRPELEEAMEGAGGAFFAKFGETTSAELKEAYEAGKAVFCSNGNGVTSLVMARTGLGLYIFTAISDANLVQHTCSNDVWSETTESYAAAVHASAHINIPGVFQGSDPLTPAMIGALAAPTPTASDNGKVLKVVNGVPAWVSA
jgi:hypothetical protein